MEPIFRFVVGKDPRLLKKLGLRPQRPTRRVYQQDQTLVIDWMAKDYPAIKRMARKEKAEIYFGDEPSVRSDYHSGSTWAPKGKTPVVTTTDSRLKINLISTVSPKERSALWQQKVE